MRVRIIGGASGEAEQINIEFNNIETFVPLRVKPSYNGKIIKYLSNNDEVELIEGTDIDGYIAITTNDGKEGYVHMSEIKQI